MKSIFAMAAAATALCALLGLSTANGALLRYHAGKPSYCWRSLKIDGGAIVAIGNFPLKYPIILPKKLQPLALAYTSTEGNCITSFIFFDPKQERSVYAWADAQPTKVLSTKRAVRILHIDPFILNVGPSWVRGEYIVYPGKVLLQWTGIPFPEKMDVALTPDEAQIVADWRSPQSPVRFYSRLVELNMSQRVSIYGEAAHSARR